jgi:predicted DNA-binding protein
MSGKGNNRKSKLVALRIPHELHDRMRTAAKRNRRTISDSIRDAIELQVGKTGRGRG